jgi:hypothetical protein
LSNLSDEEVAILAELRGYEIVFESWDDGGKLSYSYEWWIMERGLAPGHRWKACATDKEGIRRELRRLVDRDFGFPEGRADEGPKEDGTGKSL